MSAVAHGGDAGADPPGGPWRPPNTHITKQKVCGPSKSLNLRDEYRKRGNKPLKVDFDVDDQETGRPLGESGQMLITLIGGMIGEMKFPKYYPDWQKVPQDIKSTLWPEIQTYFDMRDHLRGPNAGTILSGVDHICAERYRDRKSKFKAKWFTKRQGYEYPTEIRSYPPPDMTEDEWNKFVDFCLSEPYRRRSVSNTINRSKQQYASRHGTKSYATRIYERRDTEEPLSLIQNFRAMHTENGRWDSPIAFEQYETMMRLSESGGMSETEIMEEVLGVRRGHNRGRGRKLPFASTSSSSSVTSRRPNVCTDDVPPSVKEYMSRCFEALQAANPNIVLPKFPNYNDNQHEEGEEDEDEEDEEPHDEDD